MKLEGWIAVMKDGKRRDWLASNSFGFVCNTVKRDNHMMAHLEFIKPCTITIPDPALEVDDG